MLDLENQIKAINKDLNSLGAGGLVKLKETVAELIRKSLQAVSKDDLGKLTNDIKQVKIEIT